MVRQCSPHVNLRAYTPFLLTVVVLMAVLGMPLMLANPMHEMGCPFAQGQMALCATSVLEHIKHWQAAFAMIVVEILLIVGLALAALRQWKLLGLPGQYFERIPIASRTTDRPTLLQELFSNGILNPKVF